MLPKQVQRQLFLYAKLQKKSQKCKKNTDYLITTKEDNIEKNRANMKVGPILFRNFAHRYEDMCFLLG